MSCAVLLAATPASALNMVIGDVTVTNLTSHGFTQAASALTFDGGATDQIYEMFGYLGTSAGTVRINATNFTAITPIAQSGNTASSRLSLRAAAATTLGLTAGAIVVDYSFSLLDDVTAADEDSVAWNITLRNTTAASIGVSLYTYLDLDLGGAADFNDDLATIDTQRAVVTDSNDPAALFVWNLGVVGGADHFALGAYPGIRNLLDAMGGGGSLPDAVGSFGPGDFTAAYQFDRLLPAGGTWSTAMSTNTVPEPNSAVLTAIGLIGLTLYGRQRKLPLS